MNQTSDSLPSQSFGDFYGFPSDVEQFKQDSRVSWSRLTQTWTLEAEDGEEYEYDDGIKRWIPTVCVVFKTVVGVFTKVHLPT
jgi:hypothetical protein